MLAAESSDKFEPIANFAGVDRVTMLRRFMHCRSVLAKDYVVPKGVLREGDEIKSQQYKTVGALSPGWLLVNYATQENVLDELTSMMNNQLLVSALLLTVCLPYQVTCACRRATPLSFGRSATAASFVYISTP
jgi:hypothetical protein